MTLSPPTALLSALVLALFVVAIAPAAPLSAAGGPITVVAVEERVNFPGEVGLELTAEAEGVIVEVRVVFRSAGSRLWRYAYADFEPGARIVATHQVPANAATYLPPGAEVEYFYEIRDSSGNVLTTEPAVVEYLDGRFDWNRVQIGPLELLYHDRSESQISRLAEGVQADLDRIETLLGYRAAHRIKGVIYNRADNARDVFPKQSQTTYDHGTFQGFAFPEQGIFVGLGLDRRMIAHESAHLLFRKALGDRAVDAPAWLDEGLATHLEPNSSALSARALASYPLPLSAMNTVSGTPATIHEFYDKAHSVVAYLLEEHGADNFRTLVDRMGQGIPVSRALVDVYGFDVNGLEARWRTGASPAAPGEGGTPSASPFVLIDVWILSGALFLVAALLFVGSAMKRLRRRPEAEYSERYDPDIDIERS